MYIPLFLCQESFPLSTILCFGGIEAHEQAAQKYCNRLRAKGVAGQKVYVLKDGFYGWQVVNGIHFLFIKVCSDLLGTIWERQEVDGGLGCGVLDVLHVADICAFVRSS